MKIIGVATDNPIKYEEIAEMARLYGCAPVQLPGSDWAREWPEAEGLSVMVMEQTELAYLPDGGVEHRSELIARYPDGKSQTWRERLKGRLLDSNAAPGPGVYNWDERFIPAGSSLSLHQLKERGQKVSARQLAVGAWLKSWLDYQEPTRWSWMTPRDRVDAWLKDQPILLEEATAPTRAIVERVHRGGAWFKASWNRRAKHYWWPGLNAGIPMTPKRDYVHELTFLVHDVIHWAMPDALPAGGGERDYRLYLVTRMMSEAITLVMADMVFIHQALQGGLDYDAGKRKIYPLYDPAVSERSWCLAMAHYAIRGDDSRLAKIAKSEGALSEFKAKYAPFFEEDLRWTAHNARHLMGSMDSRWRELYERFAAEADLGLSTTADYSQGWSEDDEALVDGVFGRLWARHWESPEALYPDARADAETRRLQRWWLGQLSLTYAMDDLPLSGCVRQAIVSACLEAPSAQRLSELTPLWESYVDALIGLCRVSGNDAALCKGCYPAVPPLYVSYDQDKESYRGVEETWGLVRELGVARGPGL